MIANCDVPCDDKLESKPAAGTWIGMLSAAVVIGILLGVVTYSFFTTPVLARWASLNSSL